MPRNTVALRGLAVTASRPAVQQRFEEAQKVLGADPGPVRPRRGDPPRRASVWPRCSGVEEALAAAEESVRLYRELAGKDPAHARRLASALLGLAELL